MSWERPPHESRKRARQRVRDCGLFRPGHRIHHIQGLKALDDTASASEGHIIEVDGFEITVEVDGETRRYRNHSPGRLRVVRDQQTPVVVQEAWRLIRATGPRGHQACIALDGDDFEPCRRSTTRQD